MNIHPQYFLYHIYKTFDTIPYFPSNDDRKEIILLGQGWLAKGFVENINRKKYKIKNITRNTFCNTPLLLSSIKDRINGDGYNDQYNLNEYVDNILYESIENIDIKNERVETDSSIISFKDKFLVVGLGTNTDNKDYWNKKFEEINTNEIMNNKNVCIVGAGPTGTELAFHLKDLNFDVTIVDGEKLDNLYKYLHLSGKNNILKELCENNIKLHTNQFFTEEFGKNFGFHIFAMGFRPNDLTSNWKIDNFQRVIFDKKTTTNVFAGGDCINQDYPRNAQVAYQQGAYIANYLNAIADNNTNEQIKPFEFQSNGISLYIGNNKYYTEINTRFGQIRKIIHKSIIEFYYKFI